MSEGESLFIYESEELPKFFAQSVVGPLKTMPQLFTNDEVLPAQRLVMVFGRPGVGKRTAVEHLCRKEGLSVALLNGRDLFNGTSEVELSDEQLSVQVLIIEQANDMVAGAYASKETREFALSLKKISRETGIFIFCLMDVVPRMLEMAERDILAMEVNRSFDATIYFPAPTRVDRILIFKKLFQKLLTHVNTNGGDLVDGLEEADYGFLAESAAYTTPLQIQRFVQRVGLLAVQNKGTRLERALLMRCLIMKGAASYCITAGDNGRLEDQFSTAAGIAIPSNKAAEDHEKEQQELQAQAQNYVSHFVAEDPEEEEPSGEEEKSSGTVRVAEPLEEEKNQRPKRAKRSR